MLGGLRSHILITLTEGRDGGLIKRRSQISSAQFAVFRLSVLECTNLYVLTTPHSRDIHHAHFKQAKTVARRVATTVWFPPLTTLLQRKKYAVGTHDRHMDSGKSNSLVGPAEALGFFLAVSDLSQSLSNTRDHVTVPSGAKMDRRTGNLISARQKCRGKDKSFDLTQGSRS